MAPISDGKCTRKASIKEQLAELKRKTDKKSMALAKQLDMIDIDIN